MPITQWLLSLIEPVSAIAHAAGDTILSYDPATVAQATKADDSPVTQADLAANAIIIERLTQLTPDIPILSEESLVPQDSPSNLSIAQPDTQTQSEPAWFWCVDPLDGTKGFLKALGEYSVNIALIHQGEPVLGVLRVPAFFTTYRAVILNDQSLLSEYQHDYANVVNLLKTRHQSRLRPWRVASSGAEVSKTMQSLLNHYGIVERIHAHSALKFGWVMSGRADLMLRVNPTCSWDTAAGQALLRSIGGDIVDYDQVPLRYRYHGTPWLNRSFVAVAHRSMIDDINFAQLPAEHQHKMNI